MAFSISNIFGGTPTSAPAAPAESASTPAQPGNLPANAPADPTKVEGAVPDSTSNSPLDEFKTLWEPVTTEGDNQAPVELDATKVQEAMSKADFSNLVTQENLAAITAGGEGAAKAFIDSLNAVTRQSMTQSTLITSKLIEQAVAKAQKEQQDKIPELLKKQNLRDALTDSNPLFSNPAVKPVIDAVQSQLAAKYPNSTTSELAAMAKNFVTVMGEQFAPPKQDTSADPINQTDWSNFLDPEQ